MRVLLVTWTDQLLEKLSTLSPELEYCAIVTDESEVARKLLEPFGFPKNLIYPLYDLKECVRDFYYDYVLCVGNGWERNLIMSVQKYGVPKDKIVGFSLPYKTNFVLERNLRYFKEHAADFDMFATGISYFRGNLDVTYFKKKLFNFAIPSQDLYYNFQVAKHTVIYGGGHNGIRNALIGLAPYSFHYDLSKTINNSFSLLFYLIAFDDLHNFHVPADVYKKFFRTKYLSKRLSLESVDVTVPFGSKNSLTFMMPKHRLANREIADEWSEKNYPETRAENVKILDEYLTLCEETNIRPIMILSPLSEGYRKHFSKQKLNEFYYLVEQACKKHTSAIFIDGWKLQGVIDADFRDYGHMNTQGAAKFSAFLNDFIESL